VGTILLALQSVLAIADTDVTRLVKKHHAHGVEIKLFPGDEDELFPDAELQEYGDKNMIPVHTMPKTDHAGALNDPGRLGVNVVPFLNQPTPELRNYNGMESNVA
jgi:hypothetical protein